MTAVKPKFVVNTGAIYDTSVLKLQPNGTYTRFCWSIDLESAVQVAAALNSNGPSWAQQVATTTWEDDGIQYKWIRVPVDTKPFLNIK